MTAPIALANGRYLLVSPLGEGGMATVYRAFDQRLQVWRAIKVLAPQYSTKPKLRARFETEAQTMALLEHPHIVRVYDVGTDGPSPYIVMELVTGGSLVDWLEDHGPMPAKMAVETTLAMSEGILAAHAKGIIHRDIKPHNIMVTAEGMCRVTDFGIARVGDGDNSMTKTGAVMGTWGYMAPEQRTNAKAVDVRAEVYAVGATLHTLLVDRMPMDLFAAERGDTVMEGVDDKLIDIIIKSSEYRRDDRYEDLKAFCDALRDILPELPETPTGTPPLARDPGPIPERPDPTHYATTPVPAQTTDPSLHVSHAFTGLQQQERAAPTITPINSDPRNSMPPGATLPPQPGSATNAGVQSRGVWQPGQASVAPQGPLSLNEARIPQNTLPPAPQSRGWAGVIMFLLVGVVFLAGLGGAGIYMYWSAPTGVDTPPALTDPTPQPTLPLEPEPQDSGLNVPPVQPDPVPVVAPAPQTRPGPHPAPVTPRPVGPAPVTPSPVPIVPTPRPVVVVVPRTEQPTPAPVPVASTQCVTASSPGRASIGGSIAVSASLCSEDGTSVVLWFKPADGSAWESVSMPLRLGKHVQTIQVSERFASGIQYYVAAGDEVDGSRRSPKRILVSP